VPFRNLHGRPVSPKILLAVDKFLLYFGNPISFPNGPLVESDPPLLGLATGNISLLIWHEQLRAQLILNYICSWMETLIHLFYENFADTNERAVQKFFHRQ